MPKKDRPSKHLRRPAEVSRSVATVAQVADEPANNPAPRPQPGTEIRWKTAFALVPVALAVLASLNTLWNGFASDDLAQVLNNEVIKKFSNLPLLFTTSVWSFASDIIFSVDPYYRPLFNVLFTINYAIFKTAPWGWHLVNVLIHAGATLLVYFALKELSGRRRLSALAASLFAVHPAHAESVAWVSGVTDPLMALFLLPSFYYYLRYRRQAHKAWLWLSLGFYFLALLSKETALALPLMLAYCDLFYLEDRFTFKQKAARLLALGGWFAAPTAVYFLMRFNALSAILFGGEPRYALGPALSTAPLAAVKYLALMLVPTGYSYQHYTEFVGSPASLSFIGPMALLAAVAGAIVFIRSRLLTFSAVWFIVMLAPSLAALRQFEPAYLLQDRYLYVPSIGVCLALAVGIEALGAARWLGRRAPVVAALIAVIVTGVWTAAYVRQNRVWNDTVSVYKDVVAESPRSPMAHAFLSRSYYDAGKPREAEIEAHTTLELDPTNTTAYLNLSYFAHKAGKTDKAIGYLEDAISIAPLGPLTRHNLATIHLNLALLYAQQRIMEKAEEHFFRSNEIWSRPVVWYHTARFYFNNGRYEEARALFERTMANVPRSFAQIHLDLAQVYERMGEMDRAKAAYERYVELAPPSENRERIRRFLQQRG